MKWVPVTELRHINLVVDINPLSANPTKWSNTLKQFVGLLSVFDHFVGLALKGLMSLRLIFCFVFLIVFLKVF